MKLYHIDTGYACFGIIVKNNQVIEAAPVAGWSVGKSEEYVINYFKTRKRARISVSSIMEPKSEPHYLIRSATISYGFDTHKSGARHHHFISMNIDLTDPQCQTGDPSPGMAHLLILQASAYVTKVAIDTAIARGQLSLEEANELLKNSQNNHQAIIGKRESQLKSDV